MSLADVWRELTGLKAKQTKEEPMLNQLKDLFKKEVSLVQTCKLSAMVINLLNEFNADLLKDGNSRDAAIDCIIGLLQAEKTQKPSA